jgi:dTDP-4-dehydrorhamnose reductase
VASFAPDVIINAAAYTAVDKAESEQGPAAAVNAEGPLHLARAARGFAGCRLIQVSTDYVFDGTSQIPYRPTDPTNPISVYGRTKLQGEHAVLAELGQRGVVLRTAWVYSAAGSNFLLTMLRLMRAHGKVRVVADQRGTPTAARSIARALWRIAARADIDGVLHWTDNGVATWHEFACAIAADGVAAGLMVAMPEVAAITTSEYPTPAKRPRNSVLDTDESVARLGMVPTGWRDSLLQTIAELRAVGA